MTRIVMRGCCGHMGMVISDIVAKDEEAEIVAGIDVYDNGKMSYPVFKTLEEVNVEADALIDFSAPIGLTELLAEAKKRDLPLVLCSTGYTAEQVEEIVSASKEQTILRSANMSLGPP